MSSLSPCPSDQNATYDMCFGTYDWTSGDNKGDKYIGEWKKDIMHTISSQMEIDMERKKHETWLADNEFKGCIHTLGIYMDE